MYILLKLKQTRVYSAYHIQIFFCYRLLKKFLPNTVDGASESDNSNAGPTTFKEVMGTTLNALGGYLQNQFSKK